MSGSHAISLVSGAYKSTFSAAWTPSAAGTYYWGESYAGDNNISAFTSPCTEPSFPTRRSSDLPQITTVASPAVGTAGVSDTFSDTATFDNTAVAPTGN